MIKRNGNRTYFAIVAGLLLVGCIVLSGCQAGKKVASMAGPGGAVGVGKVNAQSAGEGGTEGAHEENGNGTGSDAGNAPATNGSDKDAAASDGSGVSSPAASTAPAGGTGLDVDTNTTTPAEGTALPVSGPTAGNGTSTATPAQPAGDTAGPEQLVPWHGEVQHIFFHPLLVYPSLAFDDPDEATGFNDWYVTQDEFKKMLPQLYKNNYILIDINSMYTLEKVGGETVLKKKTLMLPPGKKPLILSVDDICYYDDQRAHGTVYRMVLDKDGNVAAYTVDPQGNKIISRDNGVVPILDQFVEEHPDFSFHGTKGMLNLTGYEGILGYRTNELSSPDYETTKQEAMKVVQRLKETGWTFSSHGYGHLHDAKVSYQTFVDDTDQWMKEVEPLIGPTPVYVYPFGEELKTGGAKYQYLIKSGFHVICGVGPTPYIRYEKDAMLMDREHIDGISLSEQQKRLMKFFDSSQVIDPNRPAKY